MELEHQAQEERLGAHEILLGGMDLGSKQLLNQTTTSTYLTAHTHLIDNLCHGLVGGRIQINVDCLVLLLLAALNLDAQ